MEVSIIIVNYNTKELTNNCINSILSWTHEIDYEIILVDNASTDGSKEFFENRNDIVYIYNDQNLGFGNANNVGYERSEGKYILLLNSDTYLLNNAIYEFWKFAESCEVKIACIGCVLYDKNLNVNASEGQFLTIKRVIKSSIKRYNLNADKIINKKNIYKNTVFPKKVEAIIGADLFIKRQIIDSYGLFDTNIFMYCEEIDLQKRYLEAGYVSVLIDTPKIVHLEGQSSNNYSARRNILFTNGVFYFLKKHSNNFNYLLFRMIYLLLKLPILFNPNYLFKDRFSILFNLLKTNKNKINV